MNGKNRLETLNTCKYEMFDIPPKCPALADKITGLFGWRHTYRVHHKQKGIPHTSYLHKSYSLTLPRRGGDNQETVCVAHVHKLPKIQ